MRLVQSSVVEMKDNCRGGTLDAAPVGKVQQVASELRDYYTRKYKCQQDLNANDAWSSGGETDAEQDEHRRTRPKAKAKCSEKEKKRRGDRRRSHLYSKSWGQFLLYFNCLIWSPLASLGPTFLTGETVGMDPEKLLYEASRALTLLLLRFMPSTPQKGRWERMPTAVDWWMLGMGCMQLLMRLWPKAYKKTTVRVKKTRCRYDR